MSAAYDLPLSAGVNCVLVAGKREGDERIAACLVRADTRADVNHTVKRLLDVRKPSFLPMERAVTESEMEYGGITPVGLPSSWRPLLDPRVLGVEVAVIGSAYAAPSCCSPTHSSRSCLPSSSRDWQAEAMMRRGIATSAVAVLLLAGCDGSGDPEPDPSAAGSSSSGDTSESASGSPTGDPGPVVTCPDATLLDPDPALPNEVPEGATSVRLCDGGADKVTPPMDALTTDVASVVSAVNDQPLVDRG